MWSMGTYVSLAGRTGRWRGDARWGRWECQKERKRGRKGRCESERGVVQAARWRGTTPNLNTNYPAALPLLILRRFIPRTDAANHVDLRGLPPRRRRSVVRARNSRRIIASPRSYCWFLRRSIEIANVILTFWCLSFQQSPRRFIQIVLSKLNVFKRNVIR